MRSPEAWASQVFSQARLSAPDQARGVPRALSGKELAGADDLQVGPDEKTRQRYPDADSWHLVAVCGRCRSAPGLDSGPNQRFELPEVQDVHSLALVHHED